MNGHTSRDILTNDSTEDVYKMADGINNALFAIAGNAELIRLKSSGAGQIDGHVASILRLTQKIAYFTTQLSTSVKSERSRD